MRPTSIENFHGLILTLIINYVTLDILQNTVPLLFPLLPPRAPGCLAVIVAAPLPVSLIVAVVVSVSLFVIFPRLTLILQCHLLFLYLLFLS